MQTNSGARIIDTRMNNWGAKSILLLIKGGNNEIMNAQPFRIRDCRYEAAAPPSQSLLTFCLVVSTPIANLPLERHI